MSDADLNASDQPELEGLRASRFRETFKISLEKTVNAITLDQVKECYPTVASLEDGEQLLADILLQVKEFWTTRAMREFDSIYLDRNVVEKLNALDRIIADAQGYEKSNQQPGIPVDQLSAEQIIYAHTRDIRRLIINQLNNLAEQVELSNAKLDDQANIIYRTTAEDLKALQKILEIVSTSITPESQDLLNSISTFYREDSTPGQ